MNELLRVAAAALLPALTSDGGTGHVSEIILRADAPPDLGLVAIALVTFVVGLTAVAAGLSLARRRDPPPPDEP